MEPQRRAAETATAFHRRQTQGLEAYAQGHICCFKAIASRIEDGRWVFQRIGDDDGNVVHHAQDCTSVGEITAAAAAAALRADVLANPGLSAKESAAQLLTAHSRPVGVGQLPSDRTLRRGVQQVREESDESGTTKTGRHLMELDAEEFSVDVVADGACHFKSHFVGIVAALKILKEAGLDYYSVDANSRVDVVPHQRYAPSLSWRLQKRPRRRNHAFARVLAEGRTWTRQRPTTARRPRSQRL